MAGYIAKDTLVTTDAFLDFGIKFAYDFNIGGDTILQLSTGMKNIFNSYQDDFDQGIERDSKYIYGPTLPRTFYVGAKIDF